MFFKYCNLLAFSTPEPFYTIIIVIKITFRTLTANKHQSNMLWWGEDQITLM